MMRTYAGFLRKYPYCCYQLFAAFLVDYCFPVLDLYAWATIDDVSAQTFPLCCGFLTKKQMGWLTRDLGEASDEVSGEVKED